MYIRREYVVSQMIWVMYIKTNNRLRKIVAYLSR